MLESALLTAAAVKQSASAVEKHAIMRVGTIGDSVHRSRAPKTKLPKNVQVFGLAPARVQGEASAP
jgi:hypothetical protein